MESQRKSKKLERNAETRQSIGRTPTSSTSEQKVPHAGHPWETGSGEGKYSYYPGGDRNAEPKEAPSAVNTVVVPDVNLPKVRKPSGSGAVEADAESTSRTWQTISHR